MMNTLHKSLTIAFLAVSIFFSGLNVNFVGAQNTALEPVTIQLRWFHQFQFAGYYAAIEKGFYAEEGLDVSLLEFDPKEGQVAPVLAGKAQYGVEDPVLLKLRAEGKPVVVLAQILQHTPQVLITKGGGGILGPEGLAGKRVMILRDDFGSAPIQAMILETLGSLDSVEFVTHSYRYEDLLEGSVDAISAYRSNEPFRMKQRGVDVDMIDPRSYGIDLYGDNLFTTDQELKKHHERAETTEFPIIFLTSLTEMENLVEGFQAGGLPFLTNQFIRKNCLHT